VCAVSQFVCTMCAVKDSLIREAARNASTKELAIYQSSGHVGLPWAFADKNAEISVGFSFKVFQQSFVAGTGSGVDDIARYGFNYWRLFNAPKSPPSQRFFQLRRLVFEISLELLQKYKG
jgi:hypothetical protein